MYLFEVRAGEVVVVQLGFFGGICFLIFSLLLPFWRTAGVWCCIVIRRLS